MELLQVVERPEHIWLRMLRGATRETEVPSLRPGLPLNVRRLRAFAGGANTALPTAGLLREAWLAYAVGSSLLINTWTRFGHVFMRGMS